MASDVNPYGIYTLEEVSKILDVSNKSLGKAIKNGDLVANKIGYGWKVTGENILKYAGTPVNTGEKS